MNNRQAAAVLRDVSPARIFARPTAEDLWLGPTRGSVLRHLVSGTPVRVLLGPASSGRSTLLRYLSYRMAEQGTSLRVPGPQTEAEDVLNRMLQSAGLPHEDLAPDEMRRLIAGYVHKQLSKGQRVLIEIDDADAFSVTAWKEVERVQSLSSSERAPELLLSMVHLDDGSSAAASFVRHQDAPALDVLSWLEPKEVSAYLLWRLDRFELAGINTPAATQLIAKCTSGCFAAIDHICQMALLLLRNRSGDQLNVDLVREAAKLLQRRHRLTGSTEGVGGSARLIVSKDGKVICEAPLKDRLLIGRSQLNDLSLNNAYLSRHHAAIFRGESGYFLSDLNSENGVSLNRQAIDCAPLCDGDVFSIGPFRIKLRMPDNVPTDTSSELTVDELADTAVMPTPDDSVPAHLKVIR